MQELKTLVVRAQSGDVEAYGTIVHRFQDMAVGYAYSLLGDFHLAEDAAQEAFVGAYLDLSGLREPAAFPGWFRKIIGARCGRFTRKKRLDTVELLETTLPADGKGPDELVEEREVREQVDAAIQSLPERERETVSLFYISQFSHREVAAFLELPVSTVKFRLHDGRKRLRKELIRMAKKNLKANRPSRDDQFATRTVEAISALNPYQIAKLLVSTDQKDLIALLQSAEEVRELILGRMPPHIRTFLAEEMKHRKTKPDDIRKAQEKALKTASKLPKAPPKPGKAFLAMKKKLKEKLETCDVVELGCEELSAIFSSMAEIARLEGKLSLEIFAGAKDSFFTTGLRLLLDGTEPAVIAEVENPWKETILEHYRTRYEMIETALAEISGGRHPMLIAHKLATIYRAELGGPLGGTTVGEKDGTAGKFKTRVKRTPFSAMNLDQLAEALMVLAWIAHKRGFDELDKILDCIDEEFAQTSLRWLLEGTEGDKLFRLAPEITLDMISTRKEALLRKRDLCYSMVVDGLVSLQMGMHPKLLEFKLRNYFE